MARAYNIFDVTFASFLFAFSCFTYHSTHVPVFGVLIMLHAKYELRYVQRTSCSMRGVLVVLVRSMSYTMHGVQVAPCTKYRLQHAWSTITLCVEYKLQ